MSESPVTYHKGDDAELLQASQRARESFKFFWNQISSDFNRIVPAVEMSAVKAAFSDDFSDDDAAVEHMWVDEVNFDGEKVYGQLLNAPNWLQSVDQGDEVSFTLAQLEDWISVSTGEVYGGHTVQVIRSRMDDAERREHDAAWGLDFPPPHKTQIPEIVEEFEVNIAKVLAEQLAKEPDTVAMKLDEGRTLLHLNALYGRAPSVRVLLEHGASPDDRCDRGWTALDYANSLQWDDVIALLPNA